MLPSVNCKMRHTWVIFMTVPIWSVREPCQLHYWPLTAFFNDCMQWVIRLQKEPGWWPGSHARTKGILDSTVSSERPGVALVTQASQLEVSRATHTAQVGQIQSLLSTLSSLSSHHLITTKPWPAASPTPRRMAGHSAAPAALLLESCLCGHPRLSL